MFIPLSSERSALTCPMRLKTTEDPVFISFLVLSLLLNLTTGDFSNQYAIFKSQSVPTLKGTICTVQSLFIVDTMDK